MEFRQKNTISNHFTNADGVSEAVSWNQISEAVSTTEDLSTLLAAISEASSASSPPASTLKPAIIEDDIRLQVATKF